MFSFFYTRRSIYFNIAFLFLIVVVWCLSYAHPVLRSFFKDEHLFYGTVSHASIPSLFGGTNIPFLDKTFFQINGDTEATFILYASQEINDEMSDWFSFAAKNASEIPLEIDAVRISENQFVVKSLATSDGELDWETLSLYHVESSLFVLGIVILGAIGFFLFAFLGIRAKR